MQKAFEKFKGTNLQFSINLSIEDILNKETTTFILKAMQQYAIGHQVIFEFTESEKIENNENLTEFIDQVQSMGARIAIDDFGSGYSNFEYLINMKIDILKIDGSIIKNIDSDINSQHITETIVGFATKLGIQTVAEFVHSESVFQKVKELGISYSQGFHFGKPMPQLGNSSDA